MSESRPILEPITIGNLTLKNRVMQLSTVTQLHNKGVVTDEQIAFYRERARGGVGSFVMEPLLNSAPPPEGTSIFLRTNLGSRSQESIDGMKRLVDAVHEEGAHIFGQVFHGGRQHHSNQFPLLLGPSAVACPYSGGVPHAMTTDEIEATIGQYIEAARIFHEVGFDGVEVHGAQGHLIQEFMSRFSNHRDDEWGGDLPRRARFMLEIIRGIRKECGADWVIGLRLATTEESPDGLEMEEAAQIAALAVEEGIEYLSLSAGNFRSIDIHIPDRSFPEMPHVSHAEGIKERIPGIPVIACGRILSPENGDLLLKNNQADVIGLSRPLICDPEWTNKAAANDDPSIRYCISCNQCWAEITAGRPIRCIQNPVTGRELAYGKGTLDTVDEPKRVVVVGGGPAGMEAARTAATRGHYVILFERARELGGSVARAATIPGHGEVGYVVDYLSQSLKPAGVEVRTGPAADVDVARILDEMPEAVVVATGARHSNEILGAPVDFPVYTSLDVVSEDVDLGDRCVLFDEDGYYEGCEVAEMIAASGTNLTIVTRFPEIAREIPRASKFSVLRELDSHGAQIITSTWYAGVDGRTVQLEHFYSGRQSTLENIDSIVHVGGKIGNDVLTHGLKGEVPEVYTIGDAYMPRRIMDAVREGHEVGRAI